MRVIETILLVEDVVKDALLVKVFTFSSICSTASVLIWSAYRFYFATLIIEYWPSLSSSPISINNNLIQVASFAAGVNATHPASIDDKTIVACFSEHQLTWPMFNMKIKPEVDFFAPYFSA